MHHVPQRAQPEVRRTQLVKATETQVCADVPPAAGGEDRARGRAHARARGQDGVLVLSQPARIDQQRQGAARPAARSPRAARAVIPRCADRCSGSTRRCARTARPATIRTARRTTACWPCGMPMLCQRCHVATRHPAIDLRQQRHHHEQEQPDVRSVVRELPLEHSRLEPSVRPVLHAIGGGGSHASADLR